MSNPWAVEEHPERSNERVPRPKLNFPREDAPPPAPPVHEQPSAPPVPPAPPLAPPSLATWLPGHAPVPELQDCPQRVIHELVRLQGQCQSGCAGLLAQPPPEQVLLKQQALLKQLAEAKPELLLAAGPEEVNRIFDYTEPLLAPYVLGPRAQTLEQAVRLVALNLDWYLQPPQALHRNEWLGQAAALLVLGCGTLNILAILAGSLFWFTGSIALISVLFAWPLWLAHHGDPRRAQWIRALHQHLLRVYTMDYEANCDARRAEPPPAAQ